MLRIKTIKNKQLKPVTRFTFETSRLFSFVLLLVCFCSFSKQQLQKEKGTYNSILIGKKVSESPLHDYIKHTVTGDQLIAVIAYGCSHCMETTSKIIKLKKNNLLDDFIILGSEAGEEGTKKTFLSAFAGDEKFNLVDYDWLSLPKKFIEPEPSFPNPPVVFFIRNNVIVKIFSELPSPNDFKKMKERIH